MLFSWYNANKRDLPWRDTKNPYHIWLSEVILQQTRVDQGLPYYLKFIEKYPSVAHLAEAGIDEVLRLWQGLGYYSRARNLHNCAKTVNSEYGGKFPEEYLELISLPGIGPYTAAAIASFAFDKKVAVVDGNVIRVLTRLFGISEDVTQRSVRNKIAQAANNLIDSENPAMFNQAIMEFGALQCVPKRPSCGICVFRDSCMAYANNQQHSIPFKGKKTIKRTRFFQYLVLQIKDQILLKRRNHNDIWKGLYEFYLLETESTKEFDTLELPAELKNNQGNWLLKEESKWHKHVLTHQIIICRFFRIDLNEDYDFNQNNWPEFFPYSISEIEQLPKSILMDNYLGDEIY